MAEQGVVVERHLGVERHQVAGAGDHQRVDLDQAAIALDEHPAEPLHERFGRADRWPLQPELGGQLAGLVALQAGVGVERLAKDQFGRVGGDFFDVHAPFAGNHQHRAGRRPIDDDAQVELAGDLAAFFDEHLAHGLAGGAGLNGDQRLAEQVAGDFWPLRRRF